MQQTIKIKELSLENKITSDNIISTLMADKKKWVEGTRKIMEIMKCKEKRDNQER